MPIDYDEKRDFIRMAADHDLEYRETGSSNAQKGICKNLSATGILFTTDAEIPEGTRLDVNITPRYSVVKPFGAEVEVIRADPIGSTGEYYVAGKIISMGNT